MTHSWFKPTDNDAMIEGRPRTGAKETAEIMGRPRNGNKETTGIKGRPRNDGRTSAQTRRYTCGPRL